MLLEGGGSVLPPSSSPREQQQQQQLGHASGSAPAGTSETDPSRAARGSRASASLIKDEAEGTAPSQPIGAATSLVKDEALGAGQPFSDLAGCSAFGGSGTATPPGPGSGEGGSRTASPPGPGSGEGGSGAASPPSLGSGTAAPLLPLLEWDLLRRVALLVSERMAPEGLETEYQRLQRK